jgi:NAD(P)-dependent dehydrogenase (short-subunit alcohol dehydrogenase family)
MTTAPKKDRYLEGRTALVTGGASGMGRAMALSLAEAGADVAVGSLLAGAEKVPGELAYHASRDELDGTREAIETLGVRCFADELDVTDRGSLWDFVEAVEKELGPVDILANAAGTTAEQTLVGHEERLWTRVLDVNLNGTFRSVRRVLPGMIERRWGRIINMASTAASVGSAGNTAYCASKAGVVGFTRAVALEGAPYGVTCNSISPGWVETGFGTNWMTHIAEIEEGTSGTAYIAEQKAQNPQGRMVQPLEVGALATFLCRDEASGITMQDLTVSAGSLW